MKPFFSFNKQRAVIYLFHLVFILLIVLRSGCSDGDNGNISFLSSETAPVSFTLAFHQAPDVQYLKKSVASAKAGAVSLVKATAETYAVDCGLIDEIECIVYDASGNDRTSETFECSTHQGIINVPVGSNLEFVILCVDADGNTLYHGEKPGVTILARQTNDLGTIDIYPFYVSSLLSPADGASVTMEDISLSWSPCETADEYRVLISADRNFNTLIVDDMTSGGSYKPSGLSPSTTYYWTVIACDTHGNQGAEPEGVGSFILTDEEPCTYAISPTSRTFSAPGGTGTITVTTSKSDCTWTAAESAAWIAITSGASGTGSGTVTYSVSANSSDAERSVTITVAGKSHTVIQEPNTPCTYAISPTSRTFSASGGTGTITVTTSKSDCTWTASESAAWIAITSGASGTGSGTVAYSVSANTTGGERTGVITAAGQTHTVTQIGCTYSISPISRTFAASGGTGTIDVSASESVCPWIATESVPWITITSGASGTGLGTVTYSVAANDTAYTRSETIAVAGLSHTVTQNPAPQTLTVTYPNGGNVSYCDTCPIYITWTTTNIPSDVPIYIYYWIGPVGSYGSGVPGALPTANDGVFTWGPLNCTWGYDLYQNYRIMIIADIDRNGVNPNYIGNDISDISDNYFQMIQDGSCFK